MKAKIILIGAISLMTLAGCKIDKKEDDQKPLTQPTEKQGTGRVSVILKAIVHKNDAFQLFYSEDSSLNFNGDQSVIVPVTGSDKVQDIVFSLPDDALPTTLRLDVGETKDQGEITVEGMTVTYYDKSLDVKGGNDFLKYFHSDNVETKTANATSAVLLAKEKDGVYDPMFYPSGELIDALKGILVK